MGEVEQQIDVIADRLMTFQLIVRQDRLIGYFHQCSK